MSASSFLHSPKSSSPSALASYFAMTWSKIAFFFAEACLRRAHAGDAFRNSGMVLW